MLHGPLWSHSEVDFQKVDLESFLFLGGFLAEAGFRIRVELELDHETLSEAFEAPDWDLY